jgi:hypothetical protein
VPAFALQVRALVVLFLVVIVTGCTKSSPPVSSANPSPASPAAQPANSSPPAPTPAPKPTPPPSAAQPPAHQHERSLRSAPPASPRPSPNATAAGSTPDAAAAPAPDPYSLGNQVEAWKNSLKTGAIEYRVPPAMTAGIPSTVTVVIHGFQDTQTSSLPDATGSGTLKVSSRMKAELLAPLSPGEFNITSQAGDPLQFVPNDGSATWIWNVTPSNKASNQQLQILVSLVYDGPSGQIQQTIEEKTYTVSVNVQKLTTTVAQSFWSNPIAWFKYVLPGGAGWGALAAVASFIAGLGWWKRKKKASGD